MTQQQPNNTQQSLQNKNKRTGLIVLCVVVGMVGMAFAAVPLYEKFCQITGFGGRAMLAEPSTMVIKDREVSVRFNADVDGNLDWNFKPDQRSVKVAAGQQALISYTAQNDSSTPLAGTAVFNVTPVKAGVYFKKTQCFCFDYQMIAPGKSAHFPVTFYIDPAFASDPNMEDVSVITLSYTFFKADSAELEQAMEAFYNSGAEDVKALPRTN